MTSHELNYYGVQLRIIRLGYKSGSDHDLGLRRRAGSRATDDVT